MSANDFLSNYGKEEIVEFLLPVAMTYRNQRDEYNEKLLTLRNRVLSILSQMRETPDKVPELIDEFEKLL